MAVELEVHDVFTDAAGGRGLDRGQRVRAQRAVAEQQGYQVLARNVLGLQDGFQVGRVLGVHLVAGGDGEHALRQVLQHALDVLALFAQLCGAFADQTFEVVVDALQVFDQPAVLHESVGKAGRGHVHHGAHVDQHAREDQRHRRDLAQRQQHVVEAREQEDGHANGENGGARLAFTPGQDQLPEADGA